jgi:hypothetical protein
MFTNAGSEMAAEFCREHHENPKSWTDIAAITRISIKLQPSEMENGNKQIPSYSKQDFA